MPDAKMSEKEDFTEFGEDGKPITLDGGKRPIHITAIAIPLPELLKKPELIPPELREMLKVAEKAFIKKQIEEMEEDLAWFLGNIPKE